MMQKKNDCFHIYHFYRNKHIIVDKTSTFKMFIKNAQDLHPI